MVVFQFVRLEASLNQTIENNQPLETIALFGGTFDPVHLGHVETVFSLKQTLEIDQVRWVLSAKPPHKDSVFVSTEQRLSMLDLALDQFPGMFSDDIEVRRDKPSYTYDTLSEFRQQYPDACIILIVGSDVMESFDTWHRAAEILNIANITVMHRAGYSNKVNSLLKTQLVEDWKTLKQRPSGSVYVYPAPAVAISSSAIRLALSAQKSCATDNSNNDIYEFLHPAVIDYIEQHQLYGFSENIENEHALKTSTNRKTNSNSSNKPFQINEDSMIENVEQHDLSQPALVFNSQQQVDMIVDELEENKALDITVLNIAEVSNFADFMVIASGTSNTHLKAISTNTIRELSRKGLKAIGEEGQESNEWVLADFGDVVVHIMHPEVRELYELEKLWNPELRKALSEEAQAN